MNKATMLKRWLPLMILAGLIAAVFAIGLDRYLSLEALRDNRAALLAIVEHHAFATAAGFVLVYTGAVALSLPSATVMTLAGGFLFGTWPGPRSMSSARPWGFLVVSHRALRCRRCLAGAGRSLSQSHGGRLSPVRPRNRVGGDAGGLRRPHTRVRPERCMRENERRLHSLYRHGTSTRMP
jgi:hypothetical protein